MWFPACIPTSYSFVEPFPLLVREWDWQLPSRQGCGHSRQTLGWWPALSLGLCSVLPGLQEILCSQQQLEGQLQFSRSSPTICATKLSSGSC